MYAQCCGILAPELCEAASQFSQCRDLMTCVFVGIVVGFVIVQIEHNVNIQDCGEVDGAGGNSVGRSTKSLSFP